MGKDAQSCAQADVSEDWQGESGASMRCLMLRAPTGVCGIMQERTADVEVEGLPSKWRRGLVGVRLECGHEFNAHALGLHFFLSKMRCPLCRHGHDERLALESVPRSVRKTYLARRERLVREQEEEEEAALEEAVEDALHFSQFEDDHLELLTLCAVFRSRGGEWSESVVSPLVRGAIDLTDTEASTEFCAQRSWRRHVCSTFGRAMRMDAEAEVVFLLRHPMLVEPVASAPMRCRDVTAFCDGSKAAAAVPLQANGAVLAGLELNPLTGEAALRVDAESLHHLCINSLVEHLQARVSINIVTAEVD